MNANWHKNCHGVASESIWPRLLCMLHVEEVDRVVFVMWAAVSKGCVLMVCRHLVNYSVHAIYSITEQHSMVTVVLDIGAILIKYSYNLNIT